LGEEDHVPIGARERVLKGKGNRSARRITIVESQSLRLKGGQGVMASID